MRLSILAVLCGALALSPQVRAQAAADPHAGHDHAAHDHDAPGPHGGTLVTLGDEEFHAELVLDEEKNQVTVVLLDGAAKKLVPLAEPHLLVNVRGAGKPRQHKLAPLYAEGQQGGPTAMYASVSEPLMDDLHSHDAEAKLVVRIGGKQYTASLHHDHEGHDHGDHEGHDHDGHDGHDH